MTWRIPLALVLSAAMAFGTAGCALVGWTVAQFAGPEKEPAEYTPPRNKTYLVFVDDMVSPVDYEPIKGDLTEQLNERLERSGTASDTVDYGDVVQLMSATPEFNRLAISEVGGRLGAEMVLYVQVDRFRLSEYQNTSTWNALLDVSVRVVDVEQQRRLWPDDRPAGYPVEPVSIPQVEMDMADYADQLSKMLAKRTAERVIDLFREHPKQR